MLITQEKTVKDIVLENHNTAKIFQKYAIDLCEKKTMTTSDICSEMSVSQNTLINQLKKVVDDSKKDVINPDDLMLDKLIDYIVLNYHSPIKDAIPIIQEHLEKISVIHIKKHPELTKVFKLFIKLKYEILQHFRKEENVLFNYIKLIAKEVNNTAGSFLRFYVENNPVNLMENSHKTAIEIFHEIERSLNYYQIPEDACTTYKVALKELQSLSNDLEENLFLESEILFPKLKELEESFS